MRYKAEPVILLESNERLRGLEYITVLHDAIMERHLKMSSRTPLISTRSAGLSYSTGQISTTEA